MRRSVRFVSAATLAVYLASVPALAHNPATHQKIVNEAWQVMRAANRDNLVGHIAWSNPALPPPTAPDLQLPGDCTLEPTDPKNFCKQTVSPVEWTQYLDEIKRSRQELGGINTELPADDGTATATCSTYTPNVDLREFARPVSVQHMKEFELHEDERKRRCDFDGAPRIGFYGDFAVPDDGEGNQGLTLGWHAQHRDDDQADIQVDVTSPVIGQVLEIVAAIYELALVAVFAPIVCLWSFLSGGDDCGEKSKRLADDLDPVDYLKGVLPGWRREDASEEARTIWHFINTQPGLSNEYDDHQGMFYEESGPGGWQSGTDHAVILAGDVAFLTLDASESAGTERYEITDDETSFSNPSTDRGQVRWQMESIGHVAFSPIDNFAYYGDMGRPNGHPGSAGRGTPTQMGWPLHAIADSSVPMHVVGTTGWGHRLYEDVADEDWPILMFESCRTGDPCDEALPTPDPDFLRLSQVQQAQRVLQQGFRWRQFLKTHQDPRDFITAIANETLAGAMVVPPGPEGCGIWCDSCSAGWAAKKRSDFEAFWVDNYTDENDKEGVRDPWGYYRGLVPQFQTAAGKQRFDNNIFFPMRAMLEQAVSATLAYLVSRSAADENCVTVGNACTPGRACCDGQCGASGCCRAATTGCYSNAECCSGGCVNEVCASTIGERCDNGGSCLAGTCTNGLCCFAGTEACNNNTDCCSGTCTAGQCMPSNCTVTGCPSGQACTNGRCCRASGQSCNNGSLCCSGACSSSGTCLADDSEACSTDNQCTSKLCVDGACCLGSGKACSQSSDCCSTLCDSSGVCRGRPDRSPCTDAVQCQSGSCKNDVCETILR